MKRLIKYLICFIMTLTAILGSYESTYAAINNNVSETYIDENRNLVRIFQGGITIYGTDYRTVTADMSRADEVQVSYTFFRKPCCASAELQAIDNVFDIFVNDIWSSRDIIHTIIDGECNTTFNKSSLDVTKNRSSNGRIEVVCKGEHPICPHCGRNFSPAAYIGDIKIVDYRGAATNIPGSIDVKPLSSKTITYDFNEYTSSVRWVVKYKGESSFTLLNEGANRGGLIARGVFDKGLVLSNIPQSFDGAQIGALVYDADGQLPAGTSESDTPFFSTINVIDTDPPVVEVSKKIDTGSKSVILEVKASDNVGLSDNPYSYDGGNTYEANSTKAITTPGIITVVVKDKTGNITRKDISVDAIDIEKANPKMPSTDEGIKDLGTDTGKGNSGNGTNTGGNTGNTGNSSGTGGNTGNKGDTGTGNTGKGTFDKVKEDGKEFVSTDKLVNDTITTVEQSKKTNDKNTSGKNSKNNNSKNTSLKAKELTDNDKEDVFERIRKNSEEYIISMRETKKEETKAAEAKKATIDLKTIEEGDEANAYTNENSDEADAYNPETKEKSIVSLVLIFVGLLLLLVILAIILFFGVIVFVKKDTEYTMLSNEEGIKVPVALLFVSFGNSERSLCFYELLNKYDTLYVRFGPLFAYIYENEKISIMTKFKGEKKREIAKEFITKEIVVGKTGGKKR